MELSREKLAAMRYLSKTALGRRSMSKRDAVVLASRTLALLMLVWTFSEFCSLPELVLSYVHYSRYEPATAYVDYMRHYHLALLTVTVAKIIVFSVVAFWLHDAGPGVAETLLPAHTDEALAQS
jgi:hypothetical protein